MENNEYKIKEGTTCGNCWGHQEYAEKEIDKIVDPFVNQPPTFIRKFVEKYV